MVSQLDQAAAAPRQFTEAHRLIGLANTVNTLTSVRKVLAEYDGDLVHSAVLTAADFHHWCERLATNTKAERLARPGLVLDRRNVIEGDILIFDGGMTHLGYSENRSQRRASSTA